MIDATMASRFAEPQRLHPLTMLYQGIVRLPGAVLAIYFSSQNGEFWFFVIVTTLMILISVPGIIMRYLYFTFYISESEVVVNSGVFSRRSRNIPIERIQNVEMRQNFLQRIFGVAQVQLETAGGQNTEGVFEFISTADAETLRLLIREYQAELEPADETEAAFPNGHVETVDASDADSAAEPGEIADAVKDGTETSTAARSAAANGRRGEELLYDMPKRTLWLYGMFRFSFWFLAAAFTIGQYTGYTPEELIDSHPERHLLDLQTNDVLTLWLFGFAFALGFLLLSWFSGILFTVNQYYGFRLAMERGKLLKQHGLLAVSKATIPLRKVQSMVMNTNPLMRKFGYAGLEVQTAGFGGDRRGPEVAVPMATTEKTLELLRRVMQVNLPETFEPISRLAIRRAFVRLLIFWSLLTFGLSFALEYYVAWLALLLPLMYYIALLRWRYRGYSIIGDMAFVRHGFWWRRVSVIPLRKIQTLSMYQSFFQRRLGLASIYIDTAGSGAINDARIDDVAQEDAERILEEMRSAFNALQSGPSSANQNDTSVTPDDSVSAAAADVEHTTTSGAAESEADSNMPPQGGQEKYEE